jgi:OmpR-family two-component system manganese-sensing sensor histidine kinase
LGREPFHLARLRLAAFYAGAFALVLLLFGATSYGLVDRALTRQIDEGSRQAAQVFTETLHVQSGRLHVGPDFGDEAQEAASTRGIVAVVVLDEHGEEVARGPTVLMPEVRWYAQPIIVHGTWHGTIRVAHDLRDTEVILKTFRQGMAIAIPLALLGTCLLGYLLAGMAIRPVRRAFEQQKRFLADASHELRTPLAVLQTQADVALEELDGTVSSLRGSLEGVSLTARRMGKLVDELLLLSRLDAPVGQRRPRLFDLGELVDEVLDDLDLTARKAQVRMEIQLGDHELLVSRMR